MKMLLLIPLLVLLIGLSLAMTHFIVPDGAEIRDQEPEIREEDV